MFGYVDTSYTAVPVNTAITNANNFFNWMGVNGIFLDQGASIKSFLMLTIASAASNNCGVTSYYSQLYTAIHNRGGQVRSFSHFAKIDLVAYVFVS